MKSAKIKHDYFVYPILRMGTIFFAKRRSRANEHLKNAHLQQLLFYDKSFVLLTANLRFCYNEAETIEKRSKVLYTKIVKMYLYTI